MKVGVDISSVSAQRTGVGTYVYELIQSLVSNDQGVDFSGYAVGLHPVPAQMMPSEFNSDHLRMPLSVIHKTWRYLKWPTVESILGNDVDVIHATNFFLPPARRAKRVLSVHDISFTTHPEWVNAKVVRPYADRMLRYCDEADAVLVFSEFTKSEMVKHYGTAPEKVFVTPHGIRPDWCGYELGPAKKVVEEADISGPYVLYVGTIEERKNIRGLLDAFAQLGDLPHKLVLVGGIGWLNEPLEDMVHARKLRDRVILSGYVSQEALPAFYRAADAFVFPSLYEGFGFPVLEAFASSCPVITSNTSSLPEVGGDAAVYADPKDSDTLAEAIRRVVTDTEFANELRAKGLQRLSTFTWARTAEMTIDVYRSVLR